MTLAPKEDVSLVPLPACPRIVFMGSPPFAVPSLEALVREGHRVVAVVTQPDRPKGRGRRVQPPPVKEAALALGLPVLQPPAVKERDFLDRLKPLSPDLLVVVAFGQILTKELMGIAPWGAINLHASLLPKYRGAAPIPWAILMGEKETGLTLMQMDEGLDTGPILAQERIRILEHDTAGDLHDRLAARSGAFLVGALAEMAKGSLIPMPQDEALASYAPKIDRNMARVRWEEDARSISLRVRAMDPWPGAHTRLGDREIRLFGARVVEPGRQGATPGRVQGPCGGLLCVETGHGVLGLVELQVPGRRRLPAPEFLRGFPLPPGTVLQ